MATTVVHVRQQPYDVYIGRNSPRGDGYFGNPYRIREGRYSCLKKFQKYFDEKLSKDPEFKEKVLELKDKSLGCYCKPVNGFNGEVLCHGQIIAAYVDGVKPSEVK